MSALLATRTARRRTITYAVLLASTLVMMALSSTAPVLEVQRALGYAFRPIQVTLTDVARGSASIADAITEIDRLRQENEQLKLENGRLKNENALVPELQRENDSLTGLLQLKSGFEYQTVAATVIAREISPVQLNRVVTIDAGTAQGVRKGAVVIAVGGALVGRVIDAGSDSAHVLLINDASSTVIGQIQSSAATGEVVGAGDSPLVMENVDSTERVEIGAQVVTAGIELTTCVRSPFPKGLLIGTVIDVARNANDVVQTAFLEAAGDLDRLEYVLVITSYQGGLPSPDREPTSVNGPEGTLPEGEQPFVAPDASPLPCPTTTPQP